jgi:hypothetical protein
MKDHVLNVIINVEGCKLVPQVVLGFGQASILELDILLFLFPFFLVMIDPIQWVLPCPAHFCRGLAGFCLARDNILKGSPVRA